MSLILAGAGLLLIALFLGLILIVHPSIAAAICGFICCLGAGVLWWIIKRQRDHDG
ncbi:MAG: hypothetical protein ACF8PN_16710 [Phycisphaerales bacterium]